MREGEEIGGGTACRDLWPLPGGRYIATGILSLLAARRVFLESEGGTLKLRAPEESVDEGLRQSLRQHKPDLLKALDSGRGFRLLCPLSWNQRSQFFLNLLEPSSPAYNLALSMRIRSTVDPEALKRAVGRVVQRHEQLRTTYRHIELDGDMTPCQLIHEEFPPDFKSIDARGWSETELSSRVHAFYRAPIDLRKGTVVRAGLYDCGENGNVFVVVFHHICADGWSMNRIHRDLAAAYRETTEVSHKVRAIPGTEYTVFALEQNHSLREEAGEGHLRHWVAKLTPPPPALYLGHEDRRPSVRRSVGATHYFSVPSGVRESLERRAAELGVTGFALLLAVFQWLLLDRSRGRDLVTGIPVMGHKGRRFEETVGYFVNPLPIRSRIGAATRFRDHALETAREVREALDHRETPIAAIVERLGGTRDSARTPAFQVLFNLLSGKTLGDVVHLLYPFDGSPAVDFGGLKAEAFPLQQQEGQFDLTMELVDRGTDILGILKYCTDLFTAEDAADLAAKYRSLLDTALADPDTVLCIEPPTRVSDASPRPVMAVAATFTAEVLGEFFDLWIHRLDWTIDVRFAPFNQLFQQLLDPASLLRANRRGYDVALVRMEDLLTESASFEEILGLLLRALNTAGPSLSVPLCIVICPSCERVESVISERRDAWENFVANVHRIPGIVLLDHEEVLRRYPVPEYLEPIGEEIGGIPYTRAYLAALSTSVVRTLRALATPPIKAIAVDCDGTLWEGVVGEDGPAGVKVSPPAKRFQEFLLDQYDAGVILCLCSKNREEDVWEVLDRHPDMVLRRKHVAFHRINWEPKSANLKALAKEMNVGLDAIAFLDDNPLERAEVHSRTPSVFCPDMPVEWSERAGWQDHLWVFDRPRITDDDRKRQEHYRAERLRDEIKRGAGTMREFMDSLNLRIDIRPVTLSDIDRVAQLSVRTNQFNTAGIRLTQKEVGDWLADPEQTIHVVSVADRFGDYGLVGVMLGRRTGNVLCVEAIYLSCRALGRGVEHRMAAFMGELARASGCDVVRFVVRTLDRNEPARTFISQLANLCAGSTTEDGLEVSSDLLAAVRFVPCENAVSRQGDADSTESVTAGDSPDRDAITRATVSFRSVDTILVEVDRPSTTSRASEVHVHERSEIESPVTDTEGLIGDVCKRVLKLDTLGTRSNFFDLGGTSLMMARIAIELQRDHGLAVSIVDLFQYPSVAALAKHLSLSSSRSESLDRLALAASRQREILRGGRVPSALSRLKAAREERH